MKSTAELKKLSGEKFQDYINGNCELKELARYALTEEFRELCDDRRIAIEHILFEAFGKALPESVAWELLKGGEFDGRVIGIMPNKRFRRARIDITLWGYSITLCGAVQLPTNLSGRYNSGSQVHIKILDEFGMFEFVENV